MQVKAEAGDVREVIYVTYKVPVVDNRDCCVYKCVHRHLITLRRHMM